MRQSPLIRFIFVVLTLIGGSTQCWSADLRGTMDSDCCGTTFRLRLSHAGNKKGVPGQEMVLRLYQGCPAPLPLWGLVSAGWLKIDAKLCDVASSQCKPTTEARIRLESVSHKGNHVSGSYSVDFPGAGHQEGVFRVKHHHEGPLPICE
jgi:hypothetical protein